MTPMSRTERTGLCDLALQVGSEQPTLCGDWTVKELVAHLVLRESSPAAIGVVVPPLAGVTEAAMRRLARREFTVLVEQLRSGPPRYSLFRLPKVEPLANTTEFFVHHEDIRRAQPGWEPRTLSDREESVLWRAVSRIGKPMLRRCGLAVTAERSDTGQRLTLTGDGSAVLLRGLPGELTMFLFGRQQHARVELEGAEPDTDRLRSASLGI